MAQKHKKYCYRQHKINQHIEVNLAGYTFFGNQGIFERISHHLRPQKRWQYSTWKQNKNITGVLGSCDFWFWFALAKYLAYALCWLIPSLLLFGSWSWGFLPNSFTNFWLTWNKKSEVVNELSKATHKSNISGLFWKIEVGKNRRSGNHIKANEVSIWPGMN